MAERNVEARLADRLAQTEVGNRRLLLPERLVALVRVRL
jgi:hypothetical protein